MATSTTPAPITFLVPGQADVVAAPAATATRGAVKASVRVGTERGGSAPVRVTARPGEDVVVLGIVNGPTLVLHPEDARDLLRAQQGGTAQVTAPVTATRGAPGAGGDVVVSAQLAWPGLEAGATRGASRGWMGQAVLGAFHVVTGLLKDPAVSLASAAITKKVDGGVEAGVYSLPPDALPPTLKGSGRLLAKVPAAADGGPMLVLVHGTFVDAVSTFGKLWAQHPLTVRELFAQYAGRVYALDHPTMGVSPIANALTLVQALPDGARLHLVTHSRGGLVAEVLARACAGKPLGADELKLFAGEGYAAHRSDLQALFKLALAKRIQVERVVRVACPARGTLLASKRFDAYLSVLQWGLQLAGVPVAPALVDFLHEVARRRADPAELPGIEAMMPESPVVAWLNRGDQLIPGELRVIAGDMEGDSIGSWVKTLLTDAFYWTDNDIVVQTRSMYGGAPRAVTTQGGGASFVLDRGAKVTHFNYFSNDSTVTAIRAALQSDTPAGFNAIGPLSWAGEDAGGLRGAPVVRGPQPDRPAVFVLPGILGSNLAVDGQRVWLGFHFLNGLKKLAWDPATASHVTPDGPIGLSYDSLIEYLGATHEVIPFAYDWRRPIEDEARRLADAVDAAVSARTASGQPVRLLAHSMGGLVARTMRLERPQTWARMMAVDGARLLMLGTPNGGSWAPMQTLSGDDTFGNALVAFGSIFDNGGARKMMAGMPGFIQLQAGLLDPAQRLDLSATWQKLADDDLAVLKARSIWHDEGAQRTIYEWGAPPQAVLTQAVALRKRLDDQIATLAGDAAKMLLVVGHADQTPVGIVQSNDGLEYLESTDGDGRVPLKSALLPGVRTWTLDAEHGKLPDVSKAFGAYVDLLTTGQTTALDPLPAEATRGAPAADDATTMGALMRSRPSHGVLASVPPSKAADTQATRPGNRADGTPRTPAKSTALRIAVRNADLKFVSQPLLIGHYRALVLTGAEWVVDGLVAQAMTASLSAGLYPDATGTHQIFNNQRPDPDDTLVMARPEAVIVAGLGEEGKLRATELSYTVCQAILAYAQRFAETPGGSAAQFELAATLIGSGGTGITPGSAAQLIAQGAFEANQKLQEAGWPMLAQLTLVELYLDRASDAWRALQVQALAAPNQLVLVGRVESGEGAIRRSLDANYRGATYDFISALPGVQENGEPTILYTLDTRRARTEVRAVRAQGTLLRELVAKASNSASNDSQIGRTLFKLLVPVEMEPFLGGTSEVLIELEAGTAVIPWELLDTDAPAQGGADARPWAIRAKLLRKLRTRDFRAQVSDANADDSVLVIGTPLCDAPYPDLPGARAEAVAVAALLGSGNGGVPPSKVRALVSGQDDARTVINALFERPYRVVHIAGHGAEGANGGVVLSGGTFLGANEVMAMRTVPELVFLNCCHLAGRDASTALQPYDRAAFAANIAQALIEVGVRCVIAAGWAVEDEPAETFATTFYSALLRGERFIGAVAAAREAAWRVNPQGNTWAAYQCYGDPGWTWQRSGGAAQRPAPVAEGYVGLSSPVELALALETLATTSRLGSANPARQMDKLRYLDATFGACWGGMGAVAEAFGVAYAELKETARAIAWYRSAVDAPDGSASFKAAEQLGDQLVRHGEALSNAADARAVVEEGVAHLSRIAALQPTVERESLLGAAYKRLAMVASRSGRDADPHACLAALKQMAVHYDQAESLARKAGSSNLFYPAKNGISAALRMAWLDGHVPRDIDARIQAVRAALVESGTVQPGFWPVVGEIELKLLSALAHRTLANVSDELITALRDLKTRVPAVWMWDSVHSEARFTLLPYQSLAGGTEAKAAKQVLACLEELARA